MIPLGIMFVAAPHRHELLDQEGVCLTLYLNEMI